MSKITAADLRPDMDVYHVDHVIELQLIAKAIRDLLDRGSYKNEGFIESVVDFFGHERNLQILTRSENQEKKAAVARLIKGEPTRDDVKVWISEMKERWRYIRRHIPTNLVRFRNEI